MFGARLTLVSKLMNCTRQIDAEDVTFEPECGSTLRKNLIGENQLTHSLRCSEAEGEKKNCIHRYCSNVVDCMVYKLFIHLKIFFSS